MTAPTKTRTKIAYAGTGLACIGFGAALTPYWWLAWPLAIAASVLMGTAIVMQHRDFKRSLPGAIMGQLAEILEPPTGVWVEGLDGTRHDVAVRFSGFDGDVAVWEVDLTAGPPFGGIAAMGAAMIPPLTGISWKMPGLKPWRHP